MLKETALAGIKKAGLVAVIRADSADHALALSDACMQGGISTIELTFTIPQAHKIIAQFRQRFGSHPGFLLGAGSVLDAHTARIALLEGVDFVVSPIFSAETQRLCNRYSSLCIPAASTATEIVACLESGADIVKLFPAELLGPSFVRSIRGPLPHVQLMPSGGVSLDNIADWLAAGAVALGLGGQLTGAAANGNYQALVTRAEQFVSAFTAANKKNN